MVDGRSINDNWRIDNCTKILKPLLFEIYIRFILDLYTNTILNNYVDLLHKNQRRSDENVWIDNCMCESIIARTQHSLMSGD